MACICCGSSDPTELHHIGRRTHPQNTTCRAECIKVPVCLADHKILTIRDGGIHGERQWKPDACRKCKMVAGLLDILALSAERAGVWVDMLDPNALICVANYHPSASEASYIIDRNSSHTSNPGYAELARRVLCIKAV